MVRRQQGFTIIELVVVIVILGILAAVAFPKFQDLSGDAEKAVIRGSCRVEIVSRRVITYASCLRREGDLYVDPARVSDALISFNL